MHTNTTLFVEEGLGDEEREEGFFYPAARTEDSFVFLERRSVSAPLREGIRRKLPVHKRGPHLITHSLQEDLSCRERRDYRGVIIEEGL